MQMGRSSRFSKEACRWSHSELDSSPIRPCLLYTSHAVQEGVASELAAAELRGRIDEKAIRAALVQIEGLSIGGEPATVESLLESGPEDLAYEIAAAIADESFLNEEERKN